MAIDVRWYVAGRVIYAAATADTPNIEDMRRFNQAMLDHLNHGSPPIYLITNLSAVGTTAFLTSYEVWKELTYMQHPSLEMGVVIGANSFILFLASVVTYLVRGKVQFYGKLDEAVTYLRQLAPDLAWETADETVLTR